MSETHDRMQCPVCGTMWPAETESCPQCTGIRTFPYTITIE